MEIWYVFLTLLLSLSGAGYMVRKERSPLYGSILYVTWVFILYALCLVLGDVSSVDERDVDRRSADERDVDRRRNTPSGYGIWEIIYWSTLVLGYLVLPILHDYQASSHFRRIDRWKEVVRRNIIWWALVLVCLAILFMLGFFYHPIIVRIPTTISIAAEVYSSAWFFGILGLGLLCWPYRMYRRYSRYGNLNSDYAALYRTVTELAQVSREVEQLCGQVHFFDQSITERDPLRPYVDQLLRLTPIALQTDENPSHIGYSDLVAIHERLRFLLVREEKLKSRRDKLFLRIKEIQAILSTDRKTFRFRRVAYALLLIAVVLSVLVLLWNEWTLIHGLLLRVNLSPLSWILNSGLPWYVLVLISSGPLFYLSRVVYLPLDTIFGFLNSILFISPDGVSLYRTLTYCRMLFPLLLNFLLLSGRRETALEDLLSSLHVQMTSEIIQVVFPWFILPVVLGAVYFWYRNRVIDTPEDIEQGIRLANAGLEIEMEVV